jgi:taurine transport system permease protein
MGNARRYVISTVSVLVVLAIWEIAGERGWINPLTLPAPSDIALTAWDMVEHGYRQTPLWQHVLISLVRALVAFVSASVLGILLGVAMGMIPPLNAVFDPFVQFLRPLPKLALIPLVVLWFGIGELSKLFLIFIAVFLTVVVGAVAAVATVKQGRIRAAQTLGVSRYQLFRYVILPHAMPELLVAVRLALGIGWTTLIAAEMIASEAGLGWMVVNAGSFLRTDVVMVGIFLLGVTGYLLDVAIVRLQRVLVPWMGRD